MMNLTEYQSDYYYFIYNSKMRNTSGISSKAAVRRLLSNDDVSSETAIKYDTTVGTTMGENRDIFNAFRNTTTSTCAHVISSVEESFSDYIGHMNRRSQIDFKNSSMCSIIVIYQTLNAFTGGTIAMRLLYEALLTAGYVDAIIMVDLNSSSSSCIPSVVLCNDSSIASSERMFLACTQPKGK
jgi:hypothetical protein